MRYLRNQTRSDCVPVAIINCLKYFGYHVTYRQDNKWIKKKLKTHRWGTKTINTFNFLNENPNFKKVKFKKSPTINDIDRDLKNGYVIILSLIDKNLRHFVFINKTYKNHYKIINYGEKYKTVSKIKKSSVSKLIKTNKVKELSIVYEQESLAWSIK